MLDSKRRVLRTHICEMLGTEYPIWLAGMGGVSMAPLVGAVSDAGGLGVGATTLGPEGLRRVIRKTREPTDMPFAVDLLAPIRDMIGRTCMFIKSPTPRSKV